MTMILTTLLAAASLCSSPAQVQARTNTTEHTAEGAEILRRILVDALDDAFDQKKEKDDGVSTQIKELNRFGGVVTQLWSDRETIQHSRVFHMPDVGLFFSLDATLPVVTKEPDKREADKSDKAKDDEWERARRELRGNGGELGLYALGGRREVKEAVIDSAAIERTLDLVLKTVARHAARIEGLSPRDTITVALRLAGRSRTLWSGDELGGGGDGAHVWTSEAEDGVSSGAFNIVLAGGVSAPEQNLVIRIALADLAGFTEGGVEQLRQRAQINRY